MSYSVYPPLPVPEAPRGYSQSQPQMLQYGRPVTPPPMMLIGPPQPAPGPAPASAQANLPAAVAYPGRHPVQQPYPGRSATPTPMIVASLGPPQHQFVQQQQQPQPQYQPLPQPQPPPQLQPQYQALPEPQPQSPPQPQYQPQHYQAPEAEQPPQPSQQRRKLCFYLDEGQDLPSGPFLVQIAKDGAPMSRQHSYASSGACSLAGPQ